MVAVDIFSSTFRGGLQACCVMRVYSAYTSYSLLVFCHFVYCSVVTFMCVEVLSLAELFACTQFEL